MYPTELEIKDTTESPTSAYYLDLLLSIGRDGQLHTQGSLKRAQNFCLTNLLDCLTCHFTHHISPQYGNRQTLFLFSKKVKKLMSLTIDQYLC